MRGDNKQDIQFSSDLLERQQKLEALKRNNFTGPGEISKQPAVNDTSSNQERQETYNEKVHQPSI
jgi:hypothetical protein